MNRGCFLTPSAPGVARGGQFVIRQPAPPVGVEWTWTVPSGYWWRLISARALLTTSAQAANRFPGYQIGDQDATRLISVGPNNAVAAAHTATVCLVQGLTFNASTESLIVNAPLTDILLPAGYEVGSLTPGLQSEDQYGELRLWVEQFEDRGAQRYAEVEHVHAVIEILQGAISNA